MLDSTRALLAQGYAWLPGRHRRSRGKPVHCRLMGKNAVALRGPEAVRFFYDESHIERRGALGPRSRHALRTRGRAHPRRPAAPDSQGTVHVCADRPRRARRPCGAPRNRVGACPAAVGGPRPGGALRRGGPAAHPRCVHLVRRAPRCRRRRGDGRRSCGHGRRLRLAGARHLRVRRARSRQEKRLTWLVEQVRGATGAAPPVRSLRRWLPTGTPTGNRWTRIPRRSSS